MKPLNFLAVKLAVLLILGILLGYLGDFDPGIAVIIALSSISLLAVAYLFSSRNSVLFGIFAVCTTLSIGVLSNSLSLEINHSGHYQQYGLSDRQLWHLKIQETEKHTSYYRVYVARVLSLNNEPSRGSIQLRIKQSDTDPLKTDDELLIWGNAQEFTKALNPYQWDYSEYLKNRNIHHQIRTSKGYVLPLNSSQRTIQGWSAELRSKLLGQLEKIGIPERELSIVKAILLGARDDISEDTFNSFRKAGAIHILAISGLHVGIILVLLRILFRPVIRLPGGRQLALACSVVLLWVYALLAGFGPSVIRAVAMFSFLAYSLYLKRITHGYNTLSLSVLFLLLVVNPKLIFEVGFQMSYAAVAAILWIHPVLQKNWKPKTLLGKRIWQLITVSLSAQLGVLPVSLLYFHQFPGLFLLSSLIVIPFLGLILGTGFAVIILSLFNWVPEVLANLYGFVIFYLNEFIAWIASMDKFHLDNLPFGPIELMLTYLLIYFLIKTLKKPKANSLALAMLSFLAIALCGIYYAWDTTNTDRLIIAQQYSHPLLIQQHGKQLKTFTSAKTIHPSIIRNYQMGARTRENITANLKSSYTINGQALIRLDSSLILPSVRGIDYLWITYAPKINLDRYLAYYTPKQIIADGSSPPYLINKWQESARLRNIPFHYTGEDGAYEFGK